MGRCYELLVGPRGAQPPGAHRMLGNPGRRHELLLCLVGCALTGTAWSAAEVAPGVTIGGFIRAEYGAGDRYPEARGEDLPIAIALGNEPIITLMAATPMLYTQLEYKMAAVMQGKPYRVVRTAKGLDVPWGGPAALAAGAAVIEKSLPGCTEPEPDLAPVFGVRRTHDQFACLEGS